jgi:hypothetical protein
MPKDNEYTLRIDSFTPATMPMARLAEYMAALADLVGFKENTHFDRLDSGSARLVSWVEPQDAPKVAQRLLAVSAGQAAKDVEKAFKAIDDMLAADNAVGELISPAGQVVIPFPGRTRPKLLTFPAFNQDGSIDGQIVKIGGKDKTAHITLQDGGITYANIELKRDLAKQLAQHLYGIKVRLFGTGLWERHPEGSWRLCRFVVDRYETLDDTPLAEVLSEIRAAGTTLTTDPDVYNELMNLRLGKDELH